MLLYQRPPLKAYFWCTRRIPLYSLCLVYKLQSAPPKSKGYKFVTNLSTWLPSQVYSPEENITATPLVVKYTVTLQHGLWHLGDTMHHKVHIYLEYHSVCPLIRIEIPHALTRKRVCPLPPRNQRGDTLACGCGRGGSEFGRRDWRKSLALCLILCALCAVHCKKTKKK